MLYPPLLQKVINVRKIRWKRVFGAITCVAAIIGGSVFAYSKYAEDVAATEQLQKLYNYNVMDGKSKEDPVVAENVTAKKTIPAFPLTLEVTQANQEKIKQGDFTGVKAIVFAERKAPGQESHGKDSKISYYDLAYWGPGNGMENNQFVRVKLTDSDRTKLYLLATQYTGQYAGYEIEFTDNDGHFTVLRLVLSGLQEKASQ